MRSVERFALLALAAGGVSAASHAGAQRSPPSYALAEDFRIGTTANAKYRFTTVAAVQPLADGRVAAITGTSSPFAWKVQVFDAAGREQWSHALGREAAPQSLAVSGDTIFVGVSSGGLFSVVVIRVGTEGPAASTAFPLERGQSARLVRSSSGQPALLVTTTGVPDGPMLEPLEQPIYELRSVGAAGTVGPVFFARHDSASHAIVGRPTPGGVQRVAFSLPWNARFSFVGAGGHTFFCSGVAYDIAVLTRDGVVARRIAPSAAPIAVTPEMRGSWLEEMRRTPLYRNVFSDSVFTAIGRLPGPGNRPVVDALFASATGELAVVRADRFPSPVIHGDTTHLDLLATDGTVRGAVALPSNVSVQAFTGQHVFATVRDTTRVAATISEADHRPIPPVQIVRYRIVPLVER